ncbi:DUF4259 domain-containing protein [Phaeacidiphilus oryzae]|uniref:DUF4259 domain-containing protein n=1 Tax=Phaeacidiphilus oryzae TaxID=348818 RepID=UPI000A040F41|nr:DUF4259 domain-containing protein [Phaeacidiphilus oryzae]
MSASGVGPFENDGAGDLCYALREVGCEGALDVLRSAFTTVGQLAAGEYLEKDYAEEAVAAAAVILARIQGDTEVLEFNGLDGLVPEIDRDMPGMAILALRRTLATDSEIYELWVDGGRGEEWRAGVESIISSLENEA